MFAGKLFRIALILFMALVIGLPTAANAQESKDLVWQRYDSVLNVQKDGSVQVTETEQIRFLSGDWHTGYREIPLDRIGDISRVQVYAQGPNGLEAISSDQSRNNGNLDITWTFPTVNGGSGDNVRTFVLKYTVSGVIRVYQTNDQLLWNAVPPDRKFPVQESTVTLNLPGNVPASEVKLQTYPQRLGGTAKPTNNGFVFHATDIPASQGMEIRAGFPPNVVNAQKPAWQAQADRIDTLNQTVKPRVNFVLLLIGFVIPVFGIVGLMILWFTKGKDPGIGKDADTISSPPSDLPAPLVGVLMDERADAQDVISAIVSLAEQGVIRITPVENTKLLGSSSDFKLDLNKNRVTSSLRPYETTLINTLFEDQKKDSVMLSEVKGWFLSSIETFKEQLYEGVVRNGLFPENPEKVRDRYHKYGVLTMVGAGILGVLGFVVFSNYADMFFILFPTLGLAGVGFALLKLSQAMPVRTLNGAVEASRWRSFRDYLSSIENTTDLSQNKEIFQRYLSYATAFNIGQSWLRKFSTVGTPAPSWYGGALPMGYTQGGGRRGRRGYDPYYGGPPIIMVPPFGGYYGERGEGGTGTVAGGATAQGNSGDGGQGIDPSVFGGGQGPLDSAGNGFGDLLDMAGEVFGGDDGGWTGGSWGGGGGLGGGWGGGGAGGFGGGGGGGGAGFG